MDTAFAWGEFVGAWLLVAGPIWQAAIELREQDIQRDEIAAAAQQIEDRPSVSPWWWLVPPLHLWLSARANKAFRRQVLGVLSDDQVFGFVSYVNKATGWLLVGLGGWLLALGQTWALHDREDWPVEIFGLVVVAMTLVCLYNTVFRMQRSRKLLGKEPRQHREHLL